MPYPYHEHLDPDPGYMEHVAPNSHVQVPILSAIGRGPGATGSDDVGPSVKALEKRIDDLDEEMSGDVTNLTKSVTEVTESVSKERWIRSFQNPTFSPFTRFVQLDDGITNSYQSSCLDSTESYFYVVTPYANVDQQAYKQSILKVIDTKSGELLNSVELPLGHGRSLTIKDNIILSSNQYYLDGDDHQGNEWVCISIEDPVNPTLVSRGRFFGRHIFWTDSGAMCQYNKGTLKKFTVEYENGVPVAFNETGEVLNTEVGLIGEEQSYQYWNGFIIIAGTVPESIHIIDAETGESVSHIDAKDSYSYLHTAEIETAFVVNGNLYFSNNSGVTKDSSGTVVTECVLFKSDLLHPKSEFYDWWRDVSYQSSRGGIAYVSGTVNPESSVSADGGESLPYRFVEDAITGYMNKTRLHFRGDSTKEIAINLTGSSYPYVAYVVNMPVTVGINGLSSSFTVIPAVYALSVASLSLNRLRFSGATIPNQNGGHPIGVYLKGCSGRTLNCQFNVPTDDALYYDAFIVACPLFCLTNKARRLYAAYSVVTHPSPGYDYLSSSYSIVQPNNRPVASFNASGNANTENTWVNFVRADNSMYRAFFNNAGIEFRKYPNQSNLSDYTTLFRISPNT